MDNLDLDFRPMLVGKKTAIARVAAPRRIVDIHTESFAQLHHTSMAGVHLNSMFHFPLAVGEQK